MKSVGGDGEPEHWPGGEEPETAPLPRRRPRTGDGEIARARARLYGEASSGRPGQRPSPTSGLESLAASEEPSERPRRLDEHEPDKGWAMAEARRILDEARAQADQLHRRAQTELAAAREHSSRIVAAAQRRAGQLDVEATGEARAQREAAHTSAQDERACRERELNRLRRLQNTAWTRLGELHRRLGSALDLAAASRAAAGAGAGAGDGEGALAVDDKEDDQAAE